MWRRRSRARDLGLLFCCIVAVACGGAARPVGAREVCRHDQTAAARVLGDPVSLRIASSDPADIECTLTGGGVRLTVAAQASSRAFSLYDTVNAHQTQVFGPAQHRASELPQNVTIPGAMAFWVPANQELVATNGTLYRGGSYVLVTVKHGHPRRGSLRALAQAVGAATLAIAPRGPNPGPPPS